MAAAFVQVKGQVLAGSTNSNIAATFDAAVGNGNAVCGIVGYISSAGPITGVTDDKGNAYTVQRTISDGGNAESAAMFYRANITNAPTTITVAFTANLANGGLMMLEASGIATSSALDGEVGQLQATPGTGANGVTSTAIVTTVNGDLICGLACDTGSFRSAAQYAPGTTVAFVEPAGGESGNTGGFTLNCATEYYVQPSAGSIAATWTATANDATISFIIALKAAAAGGTATPALGVLGLTGRGTSLGFAINMPDEP